jgi:hypothetical protein
VSLFCWSDDEDDRSIEERDDDAFAVGQAAAGNGVHPGGVADETVGEKQCLLGGGRQLHRVGRTIAGIGLGKPSPIDRGIVDEKKIGLIGLAGSGHRDPVSADSLPLAGLAGLRIPADIEPDRAIGISDPGLQPFDLRKSGDDAPVLRPRDLARGNWAVRGTLLTVLPAANPASLSRGSENSPHSASLSAQSPVGIDLRAELDPALPRASSPSSTLDW